MAFRNDSFAKSIEDIKNVPIQIPLNRKTAVILSAAKSAADILGGVSADEAEAYIQRFKSVSSALSSAELPTAEQILSAVPFYVIIPVLETAGLESLASSVSLLRSYIEDHGDVIDLPSSILSEIQAANAKYLSEEFWEKTQRAVDVLRSREHVNEITGELEIAELTAKDIADIIAVFDPDLAVSFTEELLGAINDADLSALDFDADGNADLTLKIGDAAKVEYVTEYSEGSYINEYPSVTLQVYGVSGANTTAISQAVKDELEKFNSSSNVVLLDDQAKFINDSITNVLSSMLIGGALAILVIYLFLRRIRTSLIIAVTMPLSVLCALACLYFMGITLNMVSLGGLAVGIGMLVDNSIVVIESISVERDKGKTAVTAAVDGTKLVAGSLLASTLTSVCVFFPILFTEGLSKMIFSDLSYSVIFSLTFSLIVALTVIPTLYCAVYSDKVMLAGKALESRVKQIKDKVGGTKKTDLTAAANAEKPAVSRREKRFRPLASLMRAYDSFLRAALKKRWLVLLIALVIFAGSVGLVFVTGTEFMPSVDQRTIEVSIYFDASDNLAYCEEKTRLVYDDIYEKVPDIKYISSTVGTIGLLSTAPSGVIRLLLEDGGEKTKKTLANVREIAENYGLNVSVTEVDGVLASLMSGLGGFATISAIITDDDVETLKAIAQTVRERTLAADPCFKQVTDNFSDEMLEYDIKIDKAKCIERGVDYTVAVGTLRAGIAGYTACSVIAGGESLDVSVRFKEGTIEEYYSGITNFVLGFDGTSAVTLGEVATVTSHYSPTIIKKENGKNLVTLSAEVSGMDSGSASRIFTNIIAEVLEDYEGSEFRENGVNHYLIEVFDGLTVALIASFLLLFAVMACQFESLAKPFIVIFAVPFSFTGGFLALVLTGISLNVVSFVGIIMLMGVVVNDAIVMIDRIGQFEAEGMARYDALIEGSKSRMRAIWMTTLTTVLALVPLALGIGKGSELMQPLGVVVMGGLTLATFVTLVIIPVMYSIVKRVKIPDKGAPAEVSLPKQSEAEPLSENTESEKPLPPALAAENTGSPAKREETPALPTVKLTVYVTNKSDKTPKTLIPLTEKKIPQKRKKE